MGLFPSLIDHPLQLTTNRSSSIFYALNGGTFIIILLRGSLVISRTARTLSLSNKYQPSLQTNIVTYYQNLDNNDKFGRLRLLEV